MSDETTRADALAATARNAVTTGARRAPELCCERVWPPRAWRSAPCQRKAKMQHEGKWYCGVHDPVKREAKRTEASAKWKAQSEVDLAVGRVRAAAPELLAALLAQVECTERTMRALGGFTPADIADCTSQARAAIAKATGTASAEHTPAMTAPEDAR